MGYFRIFYYITYILNFILRLIKRHGKAVLWFICIFIFLVLCMYSPKSSAVYMGDYSYGDPNYALEQAYANINLDFLRRLSKYQGSNKESFMNTLTSSKFSFYLYYGNVWDGTGMLNGATYNTQNLRIFIYSNNFYSSSSMSPSLYDDYLGISPLDIKKVTARYFAVYYFNGDGNLILYTDSNSTTSFDCQIPATLINYYDSYTWDYLFNNYSIDEIEILYDMRNKLNQVDEELQSQTDYLTEQPSSEDFSSSDLPTSSGVTATTDSGLNNIFSSLYNVFTGEPNYQHNITINVPFTR